MPKTNTGGFEPRNSRLTPCPEALREVLEAVSIFPPDVDLLDLAQSVPDLEVEFTHFLKKVSGTEDYQNPPGPKQPSDYWTARLMKLHTLINQALSPLSKYSRTTLWRDALSPRKVGDVFYGADGPVSGAELVKERAKAIQYAPIFADPERFLDIYQFISQSDESRKWYFCGYYALAKKYIVLRDQRKTLHIIINILEFEPEQRQAFAETLYPLVITERYSVDETGHFIKLHNPITDAFKGEVDLTRIRCCKNCKKLFWAGRKDQVCCTPACNHARHSRRTRAKYQRE